MRPADDDSESWHYGGLNKEESAMHEMDDRRSFLKNGAIALGGTALACAGAALAQEKKAGEDDSKKEEDVTPVEDLGREHGLLNRVLLVYDEFVRRLNAKSELEPKLVLDSANIIRHFIEDYHEKLEEEQLFPRFEKAHKLTDLVAVLRQQHQAGRGVTLQIIQRADASSLKQAAEREKLATSLKQFIRMYRPHEAREDTVLFPALRSIVSGNEYDSLGDEFEKKEHELFGREGFEGMLEKVTTIEKALGVYELSQFTPR